MIFGVRRRAYTRFDTRILLGCVRTTQYNTGRKPIQMLGLGVVLDAIGRARTSVVVIGVNHNFVYARCGECCDGCSNLFFGAFQRFTLLHRSIPRFIDYIDNAANADVKVRDVAPGACAFLGESAHCCPQRFRALSQRVPTIAKARNAPNSSRRAAADQYRRMRFLPRLGFETQS